MKKKVAILITGMFIFGTGWAIRSTFIMDNWINKPIGGAMICVGGLAVVICILWMIIKPPKKKEQ